MKIKHFLAYCISYGLWEAWHLMGGGFLPSDATASLAVATAVKALVWIGPILVVVGNDGELLLPLRALFRTNFPWFPTVVGLCLSTVFLHTVHILLTGIDTWGIYQPYWIFSSLVAAAIEEMAFRGLLFNGQAAVHGIGKAALMNGVLFAVYHYPEFLAGQSLSALFGLRFWVIVIMGVIFSWSFAKWKNLAMNIVIHYVWNMLCYWFALT